VLSPAFYRVDELEAHPILKLLLADDLLLGRSAAKGAHYKRLMTTVYKPN
jgi:hypothetical protein